MHTYIFTLKDGREIMIDAENMPEAKIGLVSVLMSEGEISSKVKIQ
jgi:hypothetical protein